MPVPLRPDINQHFSPMDRDEVSLNRVKVSRQWSHNLLFRGAGIPAHLWIGIVHAGDSLEFRFRHDIVPVLLSPVNTPRRPVAKIETPMVNGSGLS